jgi:hypothetical protein
VALGKEIAAQAVSDLAGVDPVVLPLRRGNGRSISGCATFTFSACGSRWS